MAERTEHCRFKQLNTNGKCVACCHYNTQSDVDCIGNGSKTANMRDGQEVQVSSGFVDGRDVQIDSRGYKLIDQPGVYVPDVNPNSGWGGFKHEK